MGGRHHKLPTVLLLFFTASTLSFGFSNFGDPKPLPNITLGIYSTNTTLRTFVRDEFQYGCTEFQRSLNGTEGSEECKYYGDCCTDPMRVRERLEPGTFSCQPAADFDKGQGDIHIYVVDKCPGESHEQDLSSLCERRTTSAFSLTDWPVTSSYSGVTYRNIYCAMCNGVQDISEQIKEILSDYQFMEFWWSEVRCNNDIIIRSQASEHSLIDVVTLQIEKGNCEILSTPPLGIPPHQCQPAVRNCPEGYTDEELVTMCELAPVDYRSGTDGRLYRNRFCQLCHGLESLPEVGFPERPIAYIPFPDEPTTQANESFQGNRSDESLLLKQFKIKPHIQTASRESLSSKDLRMSEAASPVILVSQENNPTQFYSFTRSFNSTGVRKYWDFGSILCDSDYDGVCDQFIKLPEVGCSGPGCGADKWQDVSGQCYSQPYYKYNPQVRKEMSFIWPLSLYGRYYSTCRPGVNTSSERNCRCDTRCHYFNECCFDAPQLEDMWKPPKPLPYFCQPFVSGGQGIGYALINSCPEKSDPDVETLCVHNGSLSFSPLYWPVTDAITNLSYRNAYCALCNDVNPNSIVFWKAALGCGFTNLTWGKCDIQRYLPPTDMSYYSCYQNLVSVCPSYFKGWKISEDCRRDVTSWVYCNEMVYRNSHCAVCNLGDDIIRATVTRSRDYLPVAGIINYETAFPLLSSLSDKRNVFILDVTSKLCCRPQYCKTSTRALDWGMINVNNECLEFPSNTTCGLIHDQLEQFAAKSLPYSYLCSSYFRPEEFDTLSRLLITDIYRSTVYRPPSYGEYFFRDVGEIPTIMIINTTWIDLNESTAICSDRSLKDLATDLHYKKFRLSLSGIQARDVIHELPVPTLQIYDYVLLGLSLFSIVCYLIWLLGWNKIRLTELMHTSLLLSLFASLLCYTLSSVPAGKDMIGCQAIAACFQFAFLATMFWTNALAISITHAMYRLVKTSNSKRYYCAYAAYAFGIPLLFTLITYLLSSQEENIATFQRTVYRYRLICFLNESIIIYSLFLAPIYLLILSNVVLCIATMIRVTRRADINSNDKDRMKKNAITCIKLSVCLGLGWALLFVAISIPDVWPIMLIFVEIQGVLVVCANTIRWKCITRMKEKISTMTTSVEQSKSGEGSKPSTELTLMNSGSRSVSEEMLN